MVVREYTLDQLESKGLSTLVVEIADALRYHRQREDSDASQAAGRSACVIVSGSVMDSSSFARSRR